jgi:hypothetical protein
MNTERTIIDEIDINYVMKKYFDTEDDEMNHETKVLAYNILLLGAKSINGVDIMRKQVSGGTDRETMVYIGCLEWIANYLNHMDELEEEALNSEEITLLQVAKDVITIFIDDSYKSMKANVV